MRHRSVIILSALLALAAPAMVESEPSHADAPARAATFTYRGLVAGLDVVAITAALQLRADGYMVGVTFHTIGMLDIVTHSDSRARVDGLWRAGQALPRLYASAGTFRGKPRQIKIDYPDGQPHVIRLEPPDDIERDPVPPDLQHNTMDALSALAQLEQLVAETGSCDRNVRVFDGRRLAIFAASTGQMEMLDQHASPLDAAPVLHCTIISRQIAGLPKDASANATVRQPQLNEVWFALQPSQLPVPVRISVKLPLVGHLTLELTDTRQGVQQQDFTPSL